jgi:hypothetical protein
MPPTSHAQVHEPIPLHKHRAAEKTDNSDRRRWHINRSVDLPTIILILSILGSGFWWISVTEKRMALQEAEAKDIRAELSEIKTSSAECQNRIEKKVDFLIEKHVK